LSEDKGRKWAEIDTAFIAYFQCTLDSWPHRITSLGRQFLIFFFFAICGRAVGWFIKELRKEEETLTSNTCASYSIHTGQRKQAEEGGSAPPPLRCPAFLQNAWLWNEARNGSAP
jgi:hypothetical protein